MLLFSSGLDRFGCLDAFCTHSHSSCGTAKRGSEVHLGPLPLNPHFFSLGCDIFRDQRSGVFAILDHRDLEHPVARRRMCSLTHAPSSISLHEPYAYRRFPQDQTLKATSEWGYQALHLKWKTRKSPTTLELLSCHLGDGEGAAAAFPYTSHRLQLPPALNLSELPVMQTNSLNPAVTQRYGMDFTLGILVLCFPAEGCCIIQY
jgi:hypothetical protein